ncbi:sugar porter family MFS transporter [Halogeometricum luteum]|uniref:Sugar porter family MFS transporter n=1 Tax=Halogeometricum luteum TaxID=2950537 RepID=A0ABU2G4I0_9EURY|nr:sugar porter family MFS transporter [Halogeometricum sp. S3BR5-2]MDS0295204.1 sugar porter family MFS transporter [Halogeometricum sp. S3BR5-2]
MSLSRIDRLANAERSHDTFVYVAAVIAAFNGLLFGFDTGVVSGALIYIEQSFGLSTFMEQVVASSVLVGAMVGAMTGGRLADRFGRRRLTLASSVLFFVGSLGMGLAPSLWSLIALRGITGLGVGVASIIGPLYISEMAPPDVRGSLGFLQQLMVTLGILLAYGINYVFAPNFLGIIGWRWMLGFGALPAVALGVGMYFLPESPRWLVENGRIDEARDVLSRMRARDDVDEEIEQIEQVSEKESEGSAADLLQPWIRPALTVGIGLAILQQVSGINTILYYAPTILTNIGLGNIASLFGTVGIGVVNVVMTCVAIYLVDRVGRRPLLLVGTGGMTLMLGVLGLGFYLPGLSGIIGYVTLASMILYVAFFAIGLGPVFWLLISEIFPLRLRGSGEGVSSFFNWTANLLVSLTFLSLIQRFGEAVGFWTLGVFSLAAVAFIYFRVPETMGRSLEEIESDLQENTVVGADERGAQADNPD